MPLSFHEIWADNPWAGRGRGRSSWDRRRRKAPRRRAGLIGAVAHGKPLVADPQMLANAEAQPCLRAALRQPHHVALRPHLHSVPARVLRVPQVEVVVVHAHAHEVFRAGFLVEAHQVIGVPLLGLPDADQIFVADLGWRPVSSRGDIVGTARPGCTCCARTNRRLRSPIAAPNAPRCRTWRRETTPGTR